ncbi:hypothetical protein [Paenibacillus alvei]|uniref:hypothetical protein n=1 Tax=Paenibacillus alvei TaxID=44250 RepID=UPI0018CF6D2C|nr:hypothetical protein [Paenibacillus alvei]MBG9736126.1 hypothetical protein [Paenibacillus alvei]MBG9743426.1 hypothetical protein [Paenibacillus alvei]MCY9579291.1 hypothetical protein [Paenibacillus alvei]MCY9585943.1 hypothetical protein [Paenibacillus alvei]
MVMQRNKFILCFSLVFCLVFGIAASAFAAVYEEGKWYDYSFTGSYTIDLGDRATTPSINFTTKPTLTSSNKISVTLEKQDKNSWNPVVQSFNYGTYEDTCALNPQNSGAGKYRIVLQVVGNNDTKKGTFMYQDWNN